MSLNWKGMFSGLLWQTEKTGSIIGDTGASQDPLDIHNDEETLTDEVPYKLEPDLAKAERYLDRIRRQGL